MKTYLLGLACAVIAAGGVPALASGASPRPGDLDVTFSGDGKLTTDFGGSDLASAVAVQVDGKLVVAGTSDGNFALARYGVDGALDPSFSGDGLVTTDVGGTDDGQGVVIQTDGKLVVAGGSEGNFALARYTTGGGLDPSFSGDGVQTTDFGVEDRATAVALQADGRIVVGGMSGDDFALARYDAAGALDPSFSGDGQQTTDFGGFDSGHDVAIGADGKIVLMGTHAPGAADFAVARYTANGELDPTFNGIGRVTTDFGRSSSTYDSGEGVAIQPDGRIVVMGYGAEFTQFGGFYTRDLQLARYETNGALDRSFSDDGRMETSFYAETLGSPKTYSGLGNGPYTFSTRAIDLAGNGSAPETRSFTVAPNPTPTPSPTATSTPSPSPAGCAATNGADVPIPISQPSSRRSLSRVAPATRRRPRPSRRTSCTPTSAT